jgi:hypothetical protein
VRTRAWIEEQTRYARSFWIALLDATMSVSGDADRNCNPLDTRKMTARLQAANRSGHPIFLDYSNFRGHSPCFRSANVSNR